MKSWTEVFFFLVEWQQEISQHKSSAKNEFFKAYPKAIGHMYFGFVLSEQGNILLISMIPII